MLAGASVVTLFLRMLRERGKATSFGPANAVRPVAERAADITVQGPWEERDGSTSIT